VNSFSLSEAGSIFFEKKKQKTFANGALRPRIEARLIDKVFLLLFVHKKKILAEP